MGTAPITAFAASAQLEVLAGLESAVHREMVDHKARRNLWFPNDHLPADALQTGEWEDELRRIRQRAAGLPDAVRVALALNLLTEEGLPHFHRLIASHFGGQSAWTAWNNMWTAEEDRHGCALRDYVRDARLFDMGALERLQYQYIEAGFDPDWEHDPYRLLAYTSLQEKATQISHANTSRLASAHEPVLQRVLAHLAGDELRHYYFYRNMFAEILAQDPGRALVALQKVTLHFAMPGHAIPGFDAMSEVVRRTGIFGPRTYQKIVEELLEFWGIAGLSGLDAAGEKARDKLMQVPARLERAAEFGEARSVRRAYSFAFIYDRAIEL